MNALRPVWSRQLQDRALAASELLAEVLQSMGPISRRDAEMRAGERVLNHDLDLLPRFSRATGLGLCIYLGNRRIAYAGAVEIGPPRDIGGFAEAELVESVLRHQKVFRGELLHEGRRQIVACRPLMGGMGHEKTPLGMIEAYQDAETFESALDTELRQSFRISDKDELSKQADRMGEVIRFIDDVSRRLQLLALNGNIIAAQAGDHGRSFRVVCRELGNLAEQSKEAVGQVQRLVHELLPTADLDDPFDGPLGDPTVVTTWETEGSSPDEAM